MRVFCCRIGFMAGSVVLVMLVVAAVAVMSVVSSNVPWFGIAGVWHTLSVSITDLGSASSGTPPATLLSSCIPPLRALIENPPFSTMLLI